MDINKIDFSALSAFAGRGREPERIDEVLAELEGIWKAHPDTRLGQLILAALDGDEKKLAYIEDDVLLEHLRRRYPAEPV